MSDRAEREKQLDWLYRLKSNLKIFIPKDFHLAEFEQSLDYAISSIKTDLKYDLLYEETKHIANISKKIESTTKNDSPKYCDRSICLKNEYNNVGCEDCEVTKSQEPTTKNDLGVETTQMIDKSNFSQEQYKSDLQNAYDCGYAQAKNDLGVDAVSRKEVINQIFYSTDNNGDVVLGSALRERIARLPSVTPQEPKCKDCKWWKDSDGKYRRGCGAESRCPMNTNDVYCGDGYCYMFSPKSDNKEKEK